MHPVFRTVLERLGLGLATLFIVSIIIFSAIEMLPGDFGEAVLGQAATKETVAAFRRELGLDEPAYMRYAQWIGNVVQGDLGTSFSGRNASGIDRSRPVVDLIAPRLWNTLFLASMTAIIAVPIALALGITSALYRNSIYDRTVNTATLTTISFPEFFVAYILILLLASLWPVFPSLANVDAATPLAERMFKAALPAMTLTLVIVAHMMRMTRAAIINLLASPYIQMARLSGASQTEVIIKHALPNAWAPLLVAFTLDIGGTILSASGLSFLGLGAEAYTAEWGLMISESRRYFLLSPHLMLYPGLAIAVTVLGFNLLGDGIRDVVDPKNRR